MYGVSEAAEVHVQDQQPGIVVEGARGTLVVGAVVHPGGWFDGEMPVEDGSDREGARGL